MIDSTFLPTTSAVESSPAARARAAADGEAGDAFGSALSAAVQGGQRGAQASGQARQRSRDGDQVSADAGGGRAAHAPEVAPDDVVAAEDGTGSDVEGESPAVDPAAFAAALHQIVSRRRGGQPESPALGAASPTALAHAAAVALEHAPALQTVVVGDAAPTAPEAMADLATVGASGPTAEAAVPAAPTTVTADVVVPGTTAETAGATAGAIDGAIDGVGVAPADAPGTQAGTQVVPADRSADPAGRALPDGPDGAVVSAPEEPTVAMPRPTDAGGQQPDPEGSADPGGPAVHDPAPTPPPAKDPAPSSATATPATPATPASPARPTTDDAAVPATAATPAIAASPKTSAVTGPADDSAHVGARPVAGSVPARPGGEPAARPAPAQPTGEATGVAGQPGPTAPGAVRVDAAAPQPNLPVMAQRIAQAVEALRNAPPPRTLSLDFPELDGLRLHVSLRGSSVHVVASGGQAALAAVDGMRHDLGTALQQRGFDLGSFDENRDPTSRGAQGDADRDGTPRRGPASSGRSAMPAAPPRRAQPAGLRL